MAEERNLVPTGAPAAVPDADDTDATKQELQRRMEEAREQISQTVTEIKESVVNQYQQVRTSINDSLDWREQYRRRPVPFAAGAFGAGLLLGMAVGGGRGEDEADREADSDRKKRRKDSKKIKGSKRSYASSPILGQAAAFGSSDLSRPALPARGETSAPSAQSRQSSSDVGPDARYTSSGYQASEQSSGRPAAGLGSFGASPDASAHTPEAEGPKGPSMFAKFKETKAYDRLQEEMSSIGDRVVEELSRTAQTVVLPALLGKLKDLVGIDIGMQKQVADRTRIETQAAQEQQRATAATEGEPDPTGHSAQGASGSASAAKSGSRGA